MVIPPERFRDEELFVTKDELEKAGFHTIIASTKKGRCPGSRGGFAIAELALSDINVEEYEAVVFVGGGGSKLLFNNSDAIRIAKEMNEQGKIIGAICLAPVILANAGVLKGKKATVAGTEAKAIETQGAKYTGPVVMVDRNIVTGNAPKSSSLFGQKLVEIIMEYR